MNRKQQCKMKLVIYLEKKKRILKGYSIPKLNSNFKTREIRKEEIEVKVEAAQVHHYQWEFHHCNKLLTTNKSVDVTFSEQAEN